MVNIAKTDFQQKSQKLGSGTQGSVYLYPLRTNTQQKSKANQSSVFKPLSTNNWF
ncbi:hypothetical protein [Streptococcus suis]|uniref:hypothetical protein n=1 Tax=Streptococcus suis TaxID=1307 RepID=UPI0037CE47E4